MDRLRPPYPDEDLYSSGIFGSLALVERYLGSESLEKSLPKAGITRVLDVGCGWSFTNLKQLARLNDAGKPIFEPNDLLAIDQGLWPDDQLKRQLGTYSDKFRRLRISVEELRDLLAEDPEHKFDFIFSRGAVSVGWLIGPEIDGLALPGMALETVQAMLGCMNTNNPNALLMLESQLTDEILPLSKQHLRRLGLDVVYSNKAKRSSWTEIYVEKGIFPNDPEDAGFNLVICKLASNKD